MLAGDIGSTRGALVLCVWGMVCTHGRELELWLFC